jgi:putative pyruvate formate lyase activating enzyme
MFRTRRQFLMDSASAAGFVSLSSLGCRNRAATTPTASTPPEHPKAGTFEPAYLRLERTGELKDRAEALWSIFKDCRLCPRRCGANRLAGEKGRCSSTAELKVASAHPHFGEERELVGQNGSGTIFFSNCNLLCAFCQNWEINHRGDGRFISHDDLAEMMLRLQRRGCHNINLVTPTHVNPHIVKALRVAIGRGLRIPLVYNTGGYDSLEVVRLLDGIVDIYLPDFKYMDGELSATYSSGARNYPEVAAQVIKEMHRQVGEVQVDSQRIATRGLMIRHLIMPHNIAGTDRFVRWVATELTPTTYVNLMAQYRPAHRAREFPKIARRPTREEIEQAFRWAREAGLQRIAS